MKVFFGGKFNGSVFRYLIHPDYSKEDFCSLCKKMERNFTSSSWTCRFSREFPVASWLVRSTPERALGVEPWRGHIVLCLWARHFTLATPLSTQLLKWVPANLLLGVTLRWTSILFRRRVKVLLVASCYGNRDKLRPDELLGSYADLPLLGGWRDRDFNGTKAKNVRNQWDEICSQNKNPEWIPS